MTEGFLFLSFFLFGVAAFLGYDGIRILRRVFPHGILWIAGEDFLYWTVTGSCFFLRLCQENDGRIRGYLLLAVALGAVSYYALFSRFLMKFLTRGIISMKNRLKKVKKAATIRMNKLHVKKKQQRSEKDNECEEETPR